MMQRSFFALAFLLAAGCGGTETTADDNGDNASTAQSDDALVVTCSPRDPSTCERYESCLTIDGAGDFCTTGRCLSARDCRDGYTCRADHCLRVEREPPTREPPTREPPQRDPCAGSSPIARGTCRSILGYYWDGRTCVGLGGCTVTNPDGLFRTERECRATFERCAGR